MHICEFNKCFSKQQYLPLYDPLNLKNFSVHAEGLELHYNYQNGDKTLQKSAVFNREVRTYVDSTAHIM